MQICEVGSLKIARSKSRTVEPVSSLSTVKGAGGEKTLKKGLEKP